MQVICDLLNGELPDEVTAFGNFMPSNTSLSIKLLVDHLIAENPGNEATASDTALDHLIRSGDVNSILDAAAVAPDRRGRFVKNVLQLIENDRLAPVNLSLVRLAWLLPVLDTDVQADPAYVASPESRPVNLFEQLAALAAVFDNFDAQIGILSLSNRVPESARGFIAPISALGLCFALDHAIDESREALLNDVAPFKTFKALAEVAAKRCDLETVDEDDTMATLAERVASIDVLIRKFGQPNRPPRSGRGSTPPETEQDPQ